MRQSTARTTAPRSNAVPAADHRTEYDEDKPLHEIEKDIACTRVRLSATVDALECELAPSQAVQKATQALRGALGPEPGPFRDQLWAYAIPLAMIVAGLSWLVALRQNSWETSLPSEFGEMPAEAIEVGETPMPAPAYADLVGPIESALLIDQKATI